MHFPRSPHVDRVGQVGHFNPDRGGLLDGDRGGAIFLRANFPSDRGRYAGVIVPPTSVYLVAPVGSGLDPQPAGIPIERGRREHGSVAGQQDHLAVGRAGRPPTAVDRVIDRQGPQRAGRHVAGHGVLDPKPLDAVPDETADQGRHVPPLRRVARYAVDGPLNGNLCRRLPIRAAGGDRLAVSCEVDHTIRRLHRGVGPKHHEQRPAGVEPDWDLRAFLRRGTDGDRLGAAGVGIPELRALAADAERAARRQRLGGGVGDEIDVRTARRAMDVADGAEEQIAMEVGPDASFLQHRLRRLAPDDLAAADVVLRDVPAVAIAPEFPGQALHLPIALRVIVQARRAARAAGQPPSPRPRPVP